MWFDGLQTFEQVAFVFACVGTGLLAIQFILLLVGMSDIGDFDMSFGEGEGLAFFSIQGLFALIALGGWTAFGCSVAGLPWWGALLIGIVVGLVAMFGIAMLYRLLGKLQQDGTVDPARGIGLSAEVYLRIPAKGEGAGKVTVNLQGALVEAEAVTLSAEGIKTGDFVKIVGYENSKYIVEKEIA